MIQKTSAPIGYGSVSSVAGPNGNPRFMPHQIVSAKPPGRAPRAQRELRRECLSSDSKPRSLQSSARLVRDVGRSGMPASGRPAWNPKSRMRRPSSTPEPNRSPSSQLSRGPFEAVSHASQCVPSVRQCDRCEVSESGTINVARGCSITRSWTTSRSRAAQALLPRNRRTSGGLSECVPPRKSTSCGPHTDVGGPGCSAARAFPIHLGLRAGSLIGLSCFTGGRLM
jgi:hypothetical protein